MRADDTATDVDVSPAERSLRVRDRARRGVVTSDPSREPSLKDRLHLGAAQGVQVLKDRGEMLDYIITGRPGRKARAGKKPARAPTKCEPPENPLRQRLKDAHLAPFEEAGAVFWAVAEVECDYDFTTTTELRGDSYVITMVATPRPRHVRVTVAYP